MHGRWSHHQSTITARQCAEGRAAPHLVSPFGNGQSNRAAASISGFLEVPAPYGIADIFHPSWPHIQLGNQSARRDPRSLPSQHALLDKSSINRPTNQRATKQTSRRTAAVSGSHHGRHPSPRKRPSLSDDRIDKSTSGAPPRPPRCFTPASDAAQPRSRNPPLSPLPPSPPLSSSDPSSYR